MVLDPSQAPPEFVSYVEKRLPALDATAHRLTGDDQHAERMARELLAMVALRWRRFGRHDAGSGLARALAEPTPQILALQPDPFSKTLDFTLNQWRKGTAGADPHLAALIALETRFDELTRYSTTLIHCDLRLDNLVLDSAGNAWICDWNFLAFGPPWFDLLTVLLSAEASGFDVDTLFAEHPVAAGLPEEALDAGLAAILGYYRYSGARPEIDNSPFVRGHQRYYGELASRWLARRQGWA